jgi:hypothetical protein
MKTLVWKRAVDIFKGEKYELFFGDVEPDDIIQGHLSNCYFLSALSSLAEESDRIKNIFHGCEVNAAGIFKLNLCVNGEYKDIVLDDWFPIDPETDDLAFSKCHDNELWVLLLEKAWAKVNMNYANTKLGMASTAFSFLTGCPAIYYDHEYEETFWKELVMADKNRYIITASSAKPELEDEDYQKLGLVSSHSYSVITVWTIKDKGKDIKLLQLRNPWGH